MVHQVSSRDEFKTKISTNQLTVVDFFATWCGPCKAIAPQLVELSKKYPNVVFLKVDVDELCELASDYGISAMPTFLFFKNGEKMAEVVGASCSKVEQTIATYL
ncbi:hypothetical protein PCK1_001538 [Pneumocystis canis]|nr:hypothetical protein PCK1_001538 [Pneumocystis canis]